MNNINELLFLFSMAISLIIFSYMTMYLLSRYLGASKNYVSSYYFGMSYLCATISVILIIISYLGLYDTSILNLSRHFDSLVGFFQLLAITEVVVWCNQYGTDKCRKCKFCKKKLKRAIPVSLMLLTVSVAQYFEDHSVTEIGQDSASMFLLVISTLICIFLACITFRFTSYGVRIYIPYILTAISNVIKLVSNNIFIDIGLVISLIAQIIFFIEVTKFIKTHDTINK